MNTETLVTILVVALVVVVLLFLMRAAGVGRRRAQLRSLPPESRERYISEWDEIESKFVDAPEQAVRQAESLVTSMLRERGHPLTERDLPDEVRRAHKLGYASKDKTEAMRQAMLQYRGVMERMMGPHTPTTSPDEQRREMA